jgi:hypothetical protein
MAAVGAFSGLRFCAEEHAIALPTAPDGWKITGSQRCVKPVPTELKTWRGTAGARSVCTADYGGAPPMHLTIYFMPNEFASAFDAEQKWTPQAGKMAFFKGSYFGVVESAVDDRAALDRFIVAIEAGLPAGSEWHH